MNSIRHLITREFSTFAKVVFAALIGIHSPSLAAASFSFELQQTYSQQTFEVFSTGALTGYRGPGFSGEIRFTADGDRRGAQSLYGVDLSIHYSRSSGANVASPLTEQLVRVGIGGGIDFRIWQFFLGMQTQALNVAITSTDAEVGFVYLSYGFRSGAIIPLSKERSFALRVGVVAEMGKTPSLESGSWFGSMYTGFAALSWRPF